MGTEVGGALGLQVSATGSEWKGTTPAIQGLDHIRGDPPCTCAGLVHEMGKPVRGIRW